MGPDFVDNVFINCPFDADYRPLLEALVFTILDCGLNPRLATERADSGEVRIRKIISLIGSCRLTIHDISRMEPLRSGELPRFNMPFELGLDLGCKTYGGSQLSAKQCLILEKEPYRYQKVLSDIAGNDVRAHEGDPRRLIPVVRDWIRVVTRKRVSAGNEICHRFSDFLDQLQTMLGHRRYCAEEIAALEIVEFIDYAREWIEETPPTMVPEVSQGQ